MRTVHRIRAEAEASCAAADASSAVAAAEASDQAEAGPIGSKRAFADLSQDRCVLANWWLPSCKRSPG